MQGLFDGLFDDPVDGTGKTEKQFVAEMQGRHDDADTSPASSPAAAASAVQHFTDSFDAGYLAAFTERLQALETYKVKHTMKIKDKEVKEFKEVEVGSRPKLVFGVRDASGSFPWYQ